jgi:hypothetical protein
MSLWGGRRRGWRIRGGEAGVKGGAILFRDVEGDKDGES